MNIDHCFEFLALTIVRSGLGFVAVTSKTLKLANIGRLDFGIFVNEKIDKNKH